MDTVFIKGLELQSLIGVYDFERHAKQRVVLDLELETSLSQAALSDSVNDTLDYGKIAQRLSHIAENSSYQLLEALGKEMIDMLQSEFSPRAITLSLHKPDILENASTVGVKFTRRFEKSEK